MSIKPATRRKLISLARMSTSERMVELVRAWAKVSGYKGSPSGWIRNPYGKRIAQGWNDFARRADSQMSALNWATFSLTSFSGFHGLCEARGDYRPTLRAECDWRLLVLAEQYNREMRFRKDERRAYTPDVTIRDDGTILVGQEIGWDERVLFEGEVPSWWRTFVGRRPTDARIDEIVDWLRETVQGRFTVMPHLVHDVHHHERQRAIAAMKGEPAWLPIGFRSESDVIVAFEDDRDAVMFRLAAENSPWGDMAAALRPDVL